MIEMNQQYICSVFIIILPTHSNTLSWLCFEMVRVDCFRTKAAKLETTVVPDCVFFVISVYHDASSLAWASYMDKTTPKPLFT